VKEVAVELNFETITPEMAQEILKHNTRNRKLSERRVASMCDDMRSGRWVINGQGISISETGRLLDGQHRLTAIVRSGIPITISVCRGAKDDVMPTIDTGKPRKASDVLAIEQENNSVQLGSTLRFIESFKNNQIGIARRFRTSNYYVIDLLAKYPRARESATFASGMRFRLLTRTILSGLHYLLTESDEEMGLEFLEKLISGDNLSKDSPIFLLREKLVSESTAKAKLPERHIVALCIKAWNLWATGGKVKILRWVPEQEGFPVIV
jgi:hypothetical protein